jgi:hypothetical protein
VDATELFEGIEAIPGSKDAGSAGGVPQSRLVNGIEFGRAASSEERKLRAAWKRREGGGPTALLLIVDDPDGEGLVRVLGPQRDGPLRRVRAEALYALVQEAAELGRVEAIRHLAEELERLDADGVPGLVVRGLGTRHLYRTRLGEKEDRWGDLEGLAAKLPTAGWREVLEALGYEIEELPKRGFLARWKGRPALVVHPHRSAREFARLDEAGRLPEGALLAACDAHNTDFGLLASGPRMRLLRAAGDDGGAATRYLELDASKLEPAARPLLGLLAPAYLAEGGFANVLREARDYGAELRLRLDRALREDILPVLGRELGRWAQGDGRDIEDDAVRGELEKAALTFVFRALFLLYAESAGHLPMDHRAYEARSFTRIAERAAEELDSADPSSTSLWRDIASLVEAMRTGQSAWGVPPYNGALFAPEEFDGAAALEVASIPDSELAPALVALARDEDLPAERGVDFSGLEIGHLGHIYEGLLSLRLSVADRDYRYDRKRDRYRPGEEGEDEGNPDVREGELFWLTNEGGRKGGGVYYTRAELVRHLVRRAVRPAFEEHLDGIAELAAGDPAAAVERLFDFAVIDPACGSAHFLVEVVDELGDQLSSLLGRVPLPALREELDSLRSAAGRARGVAIEDTALLKRLALKRCVYGVDLSPMGAEIAKVSLWLGSFVPGLSLAYLDHNVQVGNSLIGVARPEAVRPPSEGDQVSLLGEQLEEEIGRAAEKAAKLREIGDSTPEVVDVSRAIAAELEKDEAGAKRVLDLWTAEPLGLKGARDEAMNQGDELIGGAETKLSAEAEKLAAEQRALHWPLAFPEVFARENPGFDVIVGNPPWEELYAEELAWFVPYLPGLRGLPEAERQRTLEALKTKRPDVSQAFAKERNRLEAVSKYFGPDTGYRGAEAGKRDLYRLFSQRYTELLRDQGRLGVVLPRSAFLAKGSAGFRRWLVSEAAPDRVDFLLNTGRWAFDAEPRYTSALLSAQRREPSEDETFEVAGVAASASEFARQSDSPGLRIARASLGPDLEVPLLPSQDAADLLTKLRSGFSFPFGAEQWTCFPVQGDFNQTNDRALWDGATSGWPLWKGESFDQFDAHGNEALTCPSTESTLAKAYKSRPGSGSLLASTVDLAVRRKAVERTIGAARIAFRDVSRATDSRTVRACFIPPRHFLTHTAPYLVFASADSAAEAACLAIMNSLAFDWQARRFVETHLSFFVLEGLKLPELDDDAVGALATPAARLSCPDERFAEFAEATGVECGPLDEDGRAALRAEIDALVAHAWDLTPEELEIVFSDFTTDAVPEDYREAVRKRFAELG